MTVRFAMLSQSDPSCRYVYARRKFNLDTPAGGELKLVADQYALVWLNGHYVGRTYLHCHDDRRCWERFDLTAHLRPGANVLAMLLHAWGPAEELIPGVFPPGDVRFACAGGAGPCDFGDLGAWRVRAAREYRPAPRHNSLIGHEESRDLRLEPVGWREVDFDDSDWPAPKTAEQPGEPALSMLRALAEEQVFPERIVRQGRWQPGTAFRSRPPSCRQRHWRIRFQLPERQAIRFFFGNRTGSRIAIDGRELSYPIEPPAAWVELYQPVLLELPAGGHEFTGEHAGDSPLGVGWSQMPPGGDRVEWAESRDGPWSEAPAPPEPDRHHRPLTDVIVPQDRCRLGEAGTLDLRIEDEDYSIVLLLPRSMTVLPRVEIADATAGVEVELIYAERLSGVEGLTIPAAYTDRATLRAGPQTWEVAFQYKSARVLILNVRAAGGRAHVQRVWATYRHYDYEPAGRLACGDARMERIWQLCRNTMEFGSQEVIMDGPWREQLLYIGDNHVHNQACYHLFGNHEIVEWQHTLYAQGQMPDGLFQPNQPCRTPPEQYRLLDQTILWPIQLELHLLYTGREEFVRSLVPSAMRLMDGFAEQFGRAGAGDPRLRDVTGWNWVDHAGMQDGRLRSIRHDGLPTAINVLYVLALEATVRLLTLCGGAAADVERLTERADALRDWLRARHFDPKREVFADCVVDDRPSDEVSVHVNLLAILAGLSDAPAALLDRTWKQPGVLQVCGPFFRVHLFEVLHRLGRFDAILAEIRDLWGSYVDAGLTSTPEYLPISGDFWASVGHPWGASPAVYLVKSIAGLAPAEPGWRVTRFEPHLGNLDRLEVTVPTPAGPITARLANTPAGPAGTIDAPAGIKLQLGEAVKPDSVKLRTFPPAGNP